MTFRNAYCSRARPCLGVEKWARMRLNETTFEAGA